MDDFYLILPSNSSLIDFPTNNGGHFYTKLPESYDLRGDYELGLAEIQFTHRPINIKSASFTVQFEPRGHIFNHKLTDGFYENNLTLVKEINRLMYKDYMKYDCILRLSLFC